jgi:hypothetical protein
LHCAPAIIQPELNALRFTSIPQVIRVGAAA